MSSNVMVSLRPENVIRQIPWRLNSGTALGSVLILVTFSLVGWLYLTQASAVTATSYRIDELRLELGHTNNQNAALILEISELEALSRVEKRALALGFQPVDEVKYLTVTNYPVSVKDENNLYDVNPVENSVSDYVADVERPNWWVQKLDVFAEWIEGR